MSRLCHSSSFENAKRLINPPSYSEQSSQIFPAGKRYSLIHGEDQSVTLTSAKSDGKSNEHTNENNISKQSEVNCKRIKPKRMVYDTIVMKHEENGKPDGGTANTLPFHTCGCCCCSHLNDRHTKSSCHNHERNSRSQNSIASKPCHTSTNIHQRRGLNDIHHSNSIEAQDSSLLPSSPTSQMTFKDFCSSTSLHGWQHLVGQNGLESEHKSKFIWVLIVVASLGVASFFVVAAGYEFINKVVVTTIDTTTASLQDVFFPSVIVCNINQIRRSLFRGLGIKNYSDIDLLYHQFYTGLDRNLTSDEQRTIMSLATSELMVKRLMTHYTMYAKSNTTDVDKEVTKNWEEFLHNNTDFIHPFDFVKDMAVEDPGDSPVISARYGRHRMSRQNATDFLPFFGTDIGFCSLVRPQVNFNPIHDHLPFNVKMFGPKGDENTKTYTWMIKPGAKVGKANGLTLLLDANTFDYTFHRHASEGFKIAVEHHLDQPLMSMKELDITPGLETQVAVTPVLYNTTQAARNRFSPLERGCYFEGELSLAYLPKGLYRYGISNCLFEATYEKVLEICQCTPYFHWAGMKKYRRFCRGPALVCMNQVFDRIGEYDEVDYVDSNSNSEPNSNETNRKVQKRKCLAACEDQQNNVAMTTSRLPNRQTMLEWPDFCVILRKIERSCKQTWKRVDLDKAYPSLCSSLLTKIQEVSEMEQSKEANFIRQSEEESDGCRKMFSGFNILDNQKPQDMLANIDLSTVHHTGSPSSSLPYNENEMSASSSKKKTQETLIENFKTVSKEVDEENNLRHEKQSKLYKDYQALMKNASLSKDDDLILLNAIFQYARENVALVNIYIKPPVVTRILRDQRTPIIWFVANCGGILGLCMGFSIVTVFEVLHYLSQSLCGKFRNCLSGSKCCSLCEDKQTLGESLITRQPKRNKRDSPNGTDINIIGNHCIRSLPDDSTRETTIIKSNCCCVDGIILSDLNDSNASKPLLYAQTNPSNADNTVEHRFVTLAQVPTITTKDSANDTLSNISSLRTNETSF